MRIKSILRRNLPSPVVHAIKKVRYARSMKRVNESSEFDLKMIKELVRTGDCVVDIGANLGLYTKYLSDLVGPQGRVFSIEPLPSTFHILRYVTRKLGLKNVTVLNCAISGSDGWASMEVPRFQSGEDNIFEAHIVGDGTKDSTVGIRVETKTLDTLFAHLDGKITFIKCDVEGYELACLKGATRLLDASTPGWMIEVWGNPDDDSSAGFHTFGFMHSIGYDDFVFDGLHLSRRRHGEVSATGNYFFLTQQHIDTVRSANPSILGIC